jgi:primase-polymerase (primpol)-like protein
VLETFTALWGTGVYITLVLGLEALAELAPIPAPPNSARLNQAELIQGDTGEAQLSDKAIIRHALAASNRKKFRQLWNGDISGYQSHSDADEALLMMLAFWTNRDPVAMERLFRQSGLYRDKWKRDDYRARSIQTAIDCCTTTYRPRRKRPTTGVSDPLTGSSLAGSDTDIYEGIDNLRNLLSED